MLNLKRLFITILLLALTACGYTNNVIQNRDKEYLSAKSVPPLKIPPGFSSSSIHAKYPVSDKDYPENLKQVDLTPPELNK